MTFDCIYHGPQVGTYNLGGVETIAYECIKLQTQCTIETDIGLPRCNGCLKRVTESSAPRCPHRGQPKRTQEADLCGYRGVKFQVYECGWKDAAGNPIHSECSLHRYCRNQQIQSCATCDFVPTTTID